MSSRQQVVLTGGVLILVVFGMIFSYYTLSRANQSIEETKRLILEGREIGNKRGNATLGAVAGLLDTIVRTESDILGNLTNHRLVANDTNSDLHMLITQFNKTNEAGRSDAVDEIITAVISNITKVIQDN